MQVFRSLAALGIAAAFLAGCGSGDSQEGAGNAEAQGGRKAAEACLRRVQKAPTSPRTPDKDLRRIALTLDGYPEAGNVGVLMADQHGYFAAAGLNVEVSDPVDSDNVPEYVAQGAIDIGLLPEPEVAVAQGHGTPLVAVGSLVRQPTMAIIRLPGSQIEGIDDLKGKTIAINGFSFEERFLEAVLKQAGLGRGDVEVRSVAYGLVPALVSERADAIFGRRNVEGIELGACGLDPVVTPLQGLGIPPYEELVAVIRRDRLTRDRAWIRPFMSAVTRGAAAAAANPRAAAEAIAVARREVEAPQPQNVELTSAKVEATLPLLSKTGHVSHARATGLADWMREQGPVRRHAEAPSTQR